jgi:glycosyltransferase involved in cell wall biosynthesis
MSSILPTSPIQADRERPTDPKVSVVVPTLNEARNLPHVFAALPDDLHEVIVVDGRSTDDTVAVAQRLRPDVRIVLEQRRGKGAALAAGFAAVTGDIIVMLDADGSADPAEIPRFVAALVNGADFVKGSRFAQGGGSSDITVSRRLGNLALNGLVNSLYGTSYSDLCYGYNAFWTSCLPYIRVDCTGFEVETLINVRIAKAGLVIHEVPSFERDRIHGESNLNAISDGLRVLRTIGTERLRHSHRRRFERGVRRLRAMA